MKTIEIDNRDYWQQIEALKEEAAVRDVLKATVNARLMHTIPPLLTDRDLAALLKSGIEYITLKMPGHTEELALTVFKPHDPKTHRQFLYLAQCYVPEMGDAVTISQMRNS